MIKNKDLQPDFIRQKQLIDELANDSDRSKVIVGASIVDEMLERLLRKKLIYDKKIHEDTFQSSNGFLGTFSSKIKACYLFGLISKELFSDIEIIRKIRNHFAHTITGCSFENNEINGLCENFSFVKKAFQTDWKAQPKAALFILEVAVIEVALVKKITRVDTIVEFPNEINDLGFEQKDWDYLAGKQ